MLNAPAGMIGRLVPIVVDILVGWCFELILFPVNKVSVVLGGLLNTVVRHPT